jgi:hypothetical protein
MFKIKDCKTRAAVTAKPTKNVTLDLKRLQNKYKTIFVSKIVVVIEIAMEEAIVHKHGEIMFKTLQDKIKARKLATEIYDESLL